MPTKFSLLLADPIQLLRASGNSFLLVFANVETGCIKFHERNGEKTYEFLREKVGEWIQSIYSSLFNNGSCFIVCNDEWAGDILLSARVLGMNLVNWLIVPYPDGEFQANKDRFDFCKVHILWLSKGKHMFPAPPLGVTYVGNASVDTPDELDGDVLPSQGYEQRIIAHSLATGFNERSRVLILSSTMDEFALQSLQRNPHLVVVSDWRPQELEAFSERMRKRRIGGM